MGDRDAVSGDQQPDHDLGPVGSVVPAVAEGEGWKTRLTDGDGLEVVGSASSCHHPCYHHQAREMDGSMEA
jgi:hypothetical protein